MASGGEISDMGASLGWEWVRGEVGDRTVGARRVERERTERGTA